MGDGTMGYDDNVDNDNNDGDSTMSNKVDDDGNYDDYGDERQ